METQKYCSVRVSGPKNQNGGFPQNLPGRFTSVCSVGHLTIILKARTKNDDFWPFLMIFYYF